jgi:hypothetical protein
MASGDPSAIPIRHRTDFFESSSYFGYLPVAGDQGELQIAPQPNETALYVERVIARVHRVPRLDARRDASTRDQTNRSRFGREAFWSLRRPTRMRYKPRTIEPTLRLPPVKFDLFSIAGLSSAGEVSS